MLTRIILFLVITTSLLQARYVPSWTRSYEKGYSRDGPVIEIFPNFTSYWDDEPKSREECSGTINVATNSSMILTMSLNSTFDWAKQKPWTGAIQDIFFLPDYNIIFHTNATAKSELYWISDAAGTSFNWQTSARPRCVLPFFNGGSMMLLTGLANGQLVVIDPTIPSKLTYVNFFTGANEGGFLRILAVSSSARGQEKLYISDTNYVYFDSGVFTYLKKSFRAVSTATINDTLIWKNGAGYLGILLFADGKITGFTSEGVEKPFPNYSGLPKICKILLGSDKDFSDLLVLGACDGRVLTANLTAYASGNYVNLQYKTRISLSNTFQFPDPIYEMAFNYLQVTEGGSGGQIQRGEPVLIIARSVSMIYMYNLATEKFTTLATYWGPQNGTFSTPIRFVPANVLLPSKPNCVDPNYATTAYIILGLTNGRIWNLPTLPFLQVTPSPANNHLFTRRVFNNHQSPLSKFEYYGYGQKKEQLSWVAITRSLIRFYKPQEKIPRICELLNMFAQPHADCCLIYQDSQAIADSFENIDPTCQLESSLDSSYFMGALDKYNIPTIKIAKVPSFLRVQSEITNNNIVVIKFNNNHFIAIIGYRKSSLPERSDLDNLIIWDPNEKSQNYGISHLPYEKLIASYPFTAGKILQAQEAFYIRNNE